MYQYDRFGVFFACHLIIDGLLVYLDFVSGDVDLVSHVIKKSGRYRQAYAANCNLQHVPHPAL